MNSPDGETGGLIEGSHESWDTRVSCHVRPTLFERARKVSMKKFPGWFGGAGWASPRSKKDTSTCPFGVTRTYGWNWSAFVVSWLTLAGALHVEPLSKELISLMSA